MKKENYGIPAVLLCAAMYIIGLLGTVNSNIWPMVGLTVLVFILSFSSDVKKTAVQALALSLLFCVAYIALHVLGIFNDLVKSFASSGSYGISDYLSGNYRNGYDSNAFDSFLNGALQVVNLVAYLFFIILGSCTVAGKPLFAKKVHMAVDGFIPVKCAPQQMHAGQQPFYNGQPQQFAGQPGMQRPMGAQHQPNGMQMDLKSQQMQARQPQQTYNRPVQQPRQEQNHHPDK